MDEPYWLLWLAGPFFVIVGIIDHERWYERLQRHRNKNGDAVTRRAISDSFGDSRAIWVPCLFFRPLGAYMTFYGLSRFFEWGCV